MLAATEFSVGTIGDATPLTLILPRSQYETLVLIGRSEQNGNPAAFFFGERQLFQWFECAGNDHWKGVQIPNVQIEVDETSVFHPEEQWPKAGCVVRHSTVLVAMAKPSSFNSSRATEAVVLVQDLPPASQKAAFSQWQIVLGSGPEKRILHLVDADK